MATPVQPPERTQSQQTTQDDTASDLEWEYEYDNHETEQIYFTLDLSTHVPTAIQDKSLAKHGRVIRTDTADKPGNASQGPQASDTHANGQLDVELQPATVPRGELQILNLHTEKPYVKFNNSFFACYWFTDLGTQFWITNPGVTNNPKLSGHVLDVVGSSQTRLVGRPANLKRKRDVPEPELVQPRNAAQQPVDIDVEDDDASGSSDDDSMRPPALDPDQDPEQPMIIPRRRIKDPHLEAQANFMERLSALKLRRGEKDAHSIPMKVPVYYRGAHNQDELRAANADPSTLDPPAADEESLRVVEEVRDRGVLHPLLPAPAKDSEPQPRRGGVQSFIARRTALGLDPGDLRQPPRSKKRGRPSNVERGQRAAAQAAAEAQAEAEAFALDPQLGGAQTQASQDASEDVDRDPSAGPSGSQTQGEQQPRKRRRTQAQMAEARRLDELRKAKEAAAKDEKARQKEEAERPETETFETDETGRRVERRGRRTKKAMEAEEEMEARARGRVVVPGQEGREMIISFDGAVDETEPEVQREGAGVEDEGANAGDEGDEEDAAGSPEA